VIQRHHAVIRDILGHFSEGEEIETAGDSFFIVSAEARGERSELGRLFFLLFSSQSAFPAHDSVHSESRD
jgi:hypothetical protein